MPVSIAEPWLYSSLGGDRELGELVALFVAEIPTRMESLRTCWQRGDRAELARLAHQLKGAMGSYGFDQLVPAAGALEYLLRDPIQPEAITQAVDDLLALCAKVRSGPRPLTTPAPGPRG